MKLITTIKILFSGSLFLTLACREKYLLPDAGPAAGYLVVEGYINSGTGPTEIKLSRTVALVDTVNLVRERQATVTIEGDDNSTVLLAETAPGLYSTGQLALNSNLHYRLHIQTKNGGNYYSDYEPVLTTPPIDSLTWLREDGVEIYVNTHDPLNKTSHYRWEYEETWEFHSTYFSYLEYIYFPDGKIDTVGDRPVEEGNKLYYCWKDERSSKVLVGTSTSLSRDSIHLPVAYVPEKSWKIGVLYSINVKQYAITPAEYEFLRRMKKNTEQVGSLFDAQPSELTGNIHNSNDPNEIVVGHVGIANVTEKRLFIDNSEVPDWGYSRFCEQVEIPINRDVFEEYKLYVPVLIGQYSMLTGLPTTIFVTNAICGDCTLRGYNTKPSYWP